MSEVDTIFANLNRSRTANNLGLLFGSVYAVVDAGWESASSRFIKIRPHLSCESIWYYHCIMWDVGMCCCVVNLICLCSESRGHHLPSLGCVSRVVDNIVVTGGAGLLDSRNISAYCTSNLLWISSGFQLLFLKFPMKGHRFSWSRSCLFLRWTFAGG